MTSGSSLWSTVTCISGTPTPRIGKTNTGRAGSNAFTPFTAASARRRRCGRSTSFAGMAKRCSSTTCSAPATSTILNSTYLYEFYKNGFNSHVQNNVIKAKHPDRFLLCGSFDPRDEEAGVDAFRRMVAEYPIQGLKLYTAEWRNGSRGWRLNDPWAYKYLALAQELGIKNIHVHKGPTVYPLSADAFDVRDVDYAATDFPELNFIVEHVGLPRLDDFCWIAAQESNVYAGLSVAMAFVHLRPRYFAEIMANLLFWLGPDKLCFGSDYAIWSPKWLIEKFMAFELPEDLKQEYHVDLTFEVKRKILGENIARLYGIDISAQAAKLRQDGIAPGR